MKLVKKLLLLIPIIFTSLTGCNLKDEIYEDGINFTRLSFKPDFSIALTITFAYEGSNLQVDWGDGTINSETSHHYQSTLFYSITIYGDISTLSLCDAAGQPYSVDNVYITRIAFANTITTIRQNAFTLPWIQEVVIPHSVTKIEQNAFSNQSGECIFLCGHDTRPVGWHANWARINPLLSSVIWGSHISFLDGILYISYRDQNNYHATLYQCWQDKNAEIIIPEKIVINNTDYPVTNINIGAFANNHTITKITFPSTLLSIGSQSFYSCRKLIDVDMSRCSFLSHIGDQAFASCIALKKIILPASLAHLGERAFERCNQLREIIVDTNNPYYCNLGGNYSVVQGDTFIMGCCNDSKHHRIDIPNGVDTIARHALDGVYFSSVVIPNSVTYIEYNALYSSIITRSIHIDVTQFTNKGKIPYFYYAFPIGEDGCSATIHYNSRLQPEDFYERWWPKADQDERIVWTDTPL